MSEAIIVAVITGAIAIAGNFISAFITNSKTLYRLDLLEKKQDKHNCLIERMYAVEKRVELQEEKQKVANHRLEDLETKE